MPGSKSPLLPGIFVTGGPMDEMVRFIGEYTNFMIQDREMIFCENPEM